MRGAVRALVRALARARLLGQRTLAQPWIGVQRAHGVPIDGSLVVPVQAVQHVRPLRIELERRGAEAEASCQVVERRVRPAAPVQRGRSVGQHLRSAGPRGKGGGWR